MEQQRGGLTVLDGPIYLFPVIDELPGPVEGDEDVDGSARTEAPDASLGGYLETHDRPPAFEGRDGHPYTVSVEIEKTPNLAAPYAGYLVFPKWAATGVGIVGHVQTPVLVESRSSDAARTELLATPLTEVRSLLDEAVRQSQGSHS